MMRKEELTECLKALRLSPTEAAQLLGVTERTIRRWMEGEAVPGPAEAALRAWRMLDARHLAWKPDSIAVFEDDQDQIGLHREHAERLGALIARVEARGGPRNPWTVDLPNRVATFGPFEVGFYILRSGGFSLASYRRKDIPPDTARDQSEIQDAAYSIADALSRARSSQEALEAAANFTRENAAIFVRQGARAMGPSEVAGHKRAIRAAADKLGQIAVMAGEGRASYAQFEAVLHELHSLGFFPDLAIVSKIARCMVRTRS